MSTCPSRLLVNDAETLEILHGSEGDDLARHGSRARLARRRGGSHRTTAARTRAASRLPDGARWWSASLHRVDTDRWGRVVVTLAVEVTDQVRARQLIEERGRRQSASGRRSPPFAQMTLRPRSSRSPMRSSPPFSSTWQRSACSTTQTRASSRCRRAAFVPPRDVAWLSSRSRHDGSRRSSRAAGIRS